MTIRTYQAGDESAQIAIYNAAASLLPKFKPATLDDVRRRLFAPDHDATTRFLALENDQPVGYATFQASGRISYPWCKPGSEQFAEPLLQAVLEAMKKRGHGKAFAAYRGDWPTVKDFFLKQGFSQTREIVSFVVDLADLPTPAARPGSLLTNLKADDIPALLALGSDVLRVKDAAELERHLLHNPYFAPEASVVLRSRADQSPIAVGLLVVKTGYADPLHVDANMPCFRLGAFGTEGLTWKRINGMFSFLAKPGPTFTPCGLDLIREAAIRLEPTDLGQLAAQCPSDAPHLMRFYQSYFRRQGSFPIFEKAL